MKLIVRVSDGKLFEASCPDNYTDGQCFADLLSGKELYFFREVVRNPKRWMFWKKWVHTGSVWQPDNAQLFKVVSL